MGKNRKKSITKHEEEHAKKVVKILFASLIILGLFLMVAYSLLS